MITQVDIMNVLQNLAVSRPAFCSEADFQLSISWELKTYLAQHQNESYEIFLERRFEIDTKDCYVDICLESEEELYLIELKYKTIRDTVLISNRLSSKHTLKEQAANDLGRYGYLKDIYRIEKILNGISKPVKKGFAIILTNDSKYYKEPIKPLTTIDCTFRIHERTTPLNPFVNPIAWTLKNGKPKWLTNNYSSFAIQHIPSFGWRSYSMQTNSTFKYLLTEI